MFTCFLEEGEKRSNRIGSLSLDLERNMRLHSLAKWPNTTKSKEKPFMSKKGVRNKCSSGVTHRWTMHIDISHNHIKEKTGPEVHLLVTVRLSLNSAEQFYLTIVCYNFIIDSQTKWHLWLWHKSHIEKRKYVVHFVGVYYCSWNM